MKKKKTLIIIWTILLIILSSLAVRFYDRYYLVDQSMKTDLQTSYRLGDELHYFILGKAKQLDPDFEIVSFDESVPEQTREIVASIINQKIERTLNLFDNDSNFQYKITSTKNNQTLSSTNASILDEDPSFSFYGTLSYDQDGLCQYSDDFYLDPCWNSNVNLILYQYGPYEESYTQENDPFSTQDMSIDKIFLHAPKNITITIGIPQKIDYNDGIISMYQVSIDHTANFTLAEFLICSIVVAIFILITPIKLWEDIHPYKTFKQMKAGLNWTLIIILIGLTFTGVVLISGLTINGSALKGFEYFKIPFASIILTIVNLLIWIAALVSVSIAVFMLKYILCHGIWRYLKEDTYIGTLCHHLKNYINRLSEIDLADPIDKTILKYIAINIVIVGFISLFWGFAIVLLIVYGILLFFYIKSKIDVIQNNYQILLKATQELSNGNFDEEIQEDLGIFNRLKDEFNNIRIDFEKAVKEETKSQKMKTELISNVSHDLKTPLTAIRNYTELLQDSNLDQETRQEYINTLNHYTERLTRLIEDLFEVSKVNNGNIKLDLMELNIVALIEQVQVECSDLLEKRQLEVITNFPQKSITLTLDGDKTYRILENLFTNISKYAQPLTRVYIDIIENEQEVKIVFKNISQAQMNFNGDEIMERFVRGDKSRHESGSGLGLAIVKSFTEIQNGKFSIDIDGDLFKATLVFKK